ncbi:MAG: SpoIID/LytB domain-containing protein [Myxococcales bacterium]
MSASLAVALALFAAAPSAAPASTPAPPPEPSAAPSEDLPDPDDPLERLYGRKSLSFDRSMPSVSVMLMEAQSSVTFTTKGRMRLLARGGLNKTLEAPAGSTWTLTLKNYEPGETIFSIQVAEHAFSDKEDIAETKRLWGEERGYKVRTETTGSLHGIAGHVLDNRKQLILIGDPATEEKAKETLKELHAKFGFQGTLLPRLKKRPHGLIQIADAQGTVLAVAQDLASATSPDKGPFLVKEVEHGRGYKSHGRQDRTFRGDLEFVVDRAGGIAVVNLVPMESYLRGIVASEIFAKAHPEALKAQAVTARGEVLAKLGTRHLTDPYLLCAEQHCQVYTGLSGETAATDAAVAATAGETLFAPAEKGGGLVDSVYSAVCGGHSEDNEAVWGGIPDPMLRGRSDLVEKSASFDGAITDKTVKDFVTADPPAYCSVSTFSKKQKYRWEKRFTREEVDKNRRVLRRGQGAGPRRGQARLFGPGHGPHHRRRGRGDAGARRARPSAGSSPTSTARSSWSSRPARRTPTNGSSRAPVGATAWACARPAPSAAPSRGRRTRRSCTTTSTARRSSASTERTAVRRPWRARAAAADSLRPSRKSWQWPQTPGGGAWAGSGATGTTS